MIKNIHLVNFKSHKDTNIDFGNLTILSGQNGVGKSSIIQSLLLLRQTYQKNRLDHILDLNNPLCFLGNVNNVVYFLSDKKSNSEININLRDENNLFQWKFQKDDTKLNKSFFDRAGDKQLSNGFESLSLFTNDFQYISALRSWDYESDDYAVEELRQISVKEGRGELVAQYLHFFRNFEVIDSLLHADEKDKTLLAQVTAWEREISQNVNVVPENESGNYDIKYTFNTDNDFGNTEEFSKRNVGYGLSYALPIIVAILSAKPNSLIIIENPEAHVHPYGISKLTELICLAAEAGIQIIIETHSDHVINGMLVQTKKIEISKGIKKENLKVYYFERDEAGHQTNVVNVIIGEGGRALNRVTGFFDQIGKDLRELI